MVYCPLYIYLVYSTLFCIQTSRASVGGTFSIDVSMAKVWGVSLPTSHSVYIWYYIS